MSKDLLLEELLIFLLRKNFVVKKLKSPFDIIAVKNRNILLLKLASYANSVSASQINQLLSVAFLLKAKAFLISNMKDENTKLQDNTLYKRFGMPLVTVGTLKNIIEGVPLFLISSNAGIVAILDGPQLKKEIVKKNLSISALARQLGVSKSMILKYERNSSKVTLQRAFKLYDLFGPGVFKRVELSFQRPQKQEKLSEVARKYISLGFEAFDIHRFPFKTISKLDDEVILTAWEKDKNNLKILSKLLDVNSLLVFSRKKPNSDIPSINYNDFLMIEDAAEILSLLNSQHR